ncbi:hypothetical protein PAXINDRAFT_165876 [Paxillus involutus ATCC 200175]|nr:hypothetical protein PAXINDRAFT_165876 [Paxillus involutus ATCC 200175]
MQIARDSRGIVGPPLRTYPFRTLLPLRRVVDYARGVMDSSETQGTTLTEGRLLHHGDQSVFTCCNNASDTART